MMTINETALMLQVKEGNDDAFRQIVEKYQKPILNLCFKYLGNQEDAEEIAQDVFIHLYQSATSYKPEARLSTYLYRIAVNLSLNRIRDRNRKRLVSFEVFHGYISDDPFLSASEGPDSVFEETERQKIVREAIDSLPANQKTAVILKRFHELSYKEIAEVMNCSISAVEARLHRAKHNLRKKLKNFI